MMFTGEDIDNSAEDRNSIIFDVGLLELGNLGRCGDLFSQRRGGEQG